MLTQSLAGLPAFLSYFAAAIGLLALFLLIYILITPYREIALIREGNPAAAASLSGAILGFVLPLARAIAHSVGLLDMAVWGAIALVAQLVTFFAVRVVKPDLVAQIGQRSMSHAIFVAGVSVAVGILNAACMTN